MRRNKYLILSNKHKYGDEVVYWKENFCDYTTNKEEAGRYKLDHIMDHYDYLVFTDGDKLEEFLDEPNFIINEYDLYLIVTEDGHYRLGGN